MKVYHYIEFGNWDKLHRKYQSRKLDESVLLEPRSLQSLHSEQHDEVNWDRATKRATFALLEPKPIEWTNNKYFPTLWDYFGFTRGNLLLELDIPQNSPNILVGDAGYVEGYLYREHQKELNILPEYYTEDPRVAFENYQKSLIPIAQFLSTKPQYLVPEVQIQETVNLDCIKVSPIQPLLEEQLGIGEIPDETMPPIPQIFKCQEQLKPWLEQFQKRNKFVRVILDEIASKTRGITSAESIA